MRIFGGEIESTWCLAHEHNTGQVWIGAERACLLSIFFFSKTYITCKKILILISDKNVPKNKTDPKALNF